MPSEGLISVNNLQHNVLAPRTRDPQTSLLALAERYLRTQVAGQAEGTVDAKQRDLTCFLNFYVKLYGHDDRREWFKSVTEAFLKAMRSRELDEGSSSPWATLDDLPAGVHPWFRAELERTMSTPDFYKLLQG